MHKNILTVVGIIILFLGTCINPTVAIENDKKSSKLISSGDILYVGGSGEGNYTSIQDAIDDASDGDTVFVYDDSSPYYENIKVRKTIKIIGEDKKTTVINGNSKGDVIKVTDNGVNIRGFTIKNSGERQWYDAGIEIYYSDNTIISGNIISNNSIGVLSQGLSHYNTISRNTISNNFDGILFMGSGSNIIKRNNILKNEKGIFIHYFQAQDQYWLAIFNLIFKNNFLGNEEDVSLSYYGTSSSFFNLWWNNYWNKSRLLPKLIICKEGFLIDLHPSILPNLI